MWKRATSVDQSEQNITTTKIIVVNSHDNFLDVKHLRKIIDRIKNWCYNDGEEKEKENSSNQKGFIMKTLNVIKMNKNYYLDARINGRLIIHEAYSDTKEMEERKAALMNQGYIESK